MLAQDGVRQGIAYVDESHDESFCHCCTTGLSKALSFVPCCWPALPFGCLPVYENEEQVLMVFGKFYDTLRKPGMHFVNPMGRTSRNVSIKRQNMEIGGTTNPIKIADLEGNPVIVSGVVSYRVINSKAAALDVENHRDYVMTQAQTILKQVVSRYPYESTDGSASLKTESYEIGIELCRSLQEKATVAGVLIESFDLADLSYAPEIAQVMLVRQQAKALVDARQVIVDGACGIVTQAIERLHDEGHELEAGEKSKLMINLLTVMVGEQAAAPVIDVGVGA